MKKFFLFIAFFLLGFNVEAGINVESGCYVKTPDAFGKNLSYFFIRSYYDNDLQEQIGAFVEYNNSKKHIPLAFYDEIQEEGPNSGDYQRFWLEIVGKKITGQYVEHGNYSGNAGGKYIKYTNFKSNKTTEFRIATIDSPCTAGR